MRMDEFTEQAIRGAAECLQWTASDSSEDGGNGYPIGDGGDEHTDAVAAISGLVEMVTDFVAANWEAIQATGMDGGQCGHDLVLTANHHGTGFWDRGYDEPTGRLLTDAAHVYSLDADFALFGDRADGENSLSDEIMWLCVENTVIVNRTGEVGPDWTTE